MSDWKPCSECHLYAGEWHEDDGVRWAVRADVTVKEGETWVCTWCKQKDD